MPVSRNESNESHAARTVAGQLAAEAAYAEVKSALDSSGINCIVLKGPHLGAVVYEVASQREYTDLDLLVMPAQFDEAVSVLIDFGFTPVEVPVDRYLRSFESPQGWPVELHRAFEAYQLFRVDYEGLFDRAEPFKFGEVDAHGLAREDLLVHLVIHVAKSLYREIGRKHVRDVGLVVLDRFPWDLFVVRARDARCQTASWVLLSAVSRIYSVDVPREAMRQFRPSVLRRAWLDLWITRASYPLFRWRLLPIWLTRLVVVPGIVDRMWDGIAGGYRFAALRARDFMRRH